MTADQQLHRQLDPPVVGTVALAARTSHVLASIKKINSTRPTIPTPRAKVLLPCKHTRPRTQDRAQLVLDYPTPVQIRKNRKSQRKTRRRLRIPTIQNQTMIMTTLTTVMTAMTTPMKTAKIEKRNPREIRERRDSWARPQNLAGRSLDRHSLLRPPLPPSSSLLLLQFKQQSHRSRMCLIYCQDLQLSPQLSPKRVASTLCSRNNNNSHPNSSPTCSPICK